VSALTDRNFFLLAVVIYGCSMLYSVFLWRKGFRQDNRLNYALLATAFIFHTVAMVKRGFSFERCPVTNLYEAITFIAWTIVASYVVFGAWSRLRFLGAFASPVLFVVGVFALMPSLDPPPGPRPDFSGGLGSLHAALVLLSIGAFGLSCIAGLMYLTQEHNLKFNKLRAVLSLLPPIERMERVTSRLLVVGFILLTAGLSLSPVLMHRKYGVLFQSDPMINWSLFVWALYLVLLGMRWWWKQSGHRIAWGAVGSFAFVMLTFWGFILLSPAHQP
jgi:ABC-type transport system involved in cytochrome c biogenesis permease subunit